MSEPVRPPAGCLLESDTDPPYESIYGGRGRLGVTHFDFGGAAHPANFTVYEIPPGASEGVHVHRADDAANAYDEFYYIVSGRGVMQIAGQDVAVQTGDHVYTPTDVAHGIENTSGEMLKVLVTYVARGRG